MHTDRKALRCRVVRKGVMQLVTRVFGLPLVGAFRLLHVMLFLTGMAMLGEWPGRGGAAAALFKMHKGAFH